jgi:hypothetical protein
MSNKKTRKFDICTLKHSQSETDFLFDSLKMQNQSAEYLNSIGFSVYDNKGNIELSSHNIGRGKRKRIKYINCPNCEERQLNNVEFCRYCGEFLEPYND